MINKLIIPATCMVCAGATTYLYDSAANPFIAGACFLAGGVMFGLAAKNPFTWSNRNTNQDGFLHGVDLSEWDYLGYSEPKFTNNGTVTSSMVVAMFLSKDGKRRQIKMVGTDYPEGFQHHKFVVTMLQPWAAGEGEFYNNVLCPSNFLEDKMYEMGGYMWDAGSGKWVSSNKAPAPSRRENPTADGNVINVDFSKS